MQAIAFLCMVGREFHRKGGEKMWTQGILYALFELDVSPEEIDYCIAQLRVADSMGEEEGAEFIFPRKDGS
jgi:hypothetical protein